MTVVKPPIENSIKVFIIKTEETENIIVDEANDRTYVVMAERTLSDGEVYRIIRLEILSCGPLARGERRVISASKWGKASGGRPRSDN